MQIGWTRAEADQLGTPPCARCGRPATGFATINDDRVCHGDDDDDDDNMSCYELANLALGQE